MDGGLAPSQLLAIIIAGITVALVAAGYGLYQLRKRQKLKLAPAQKYVEPTVPEWDP